MPSIPAVFPLLLSLAAVLLEDRVARRRALAGAVLATLAVASLVVAGGDDWRSASLPRSYLATTAALVLLAACLTAAGGKAHWRQRPLAASVLGAGAVLALLVARPLALAGGMARTIAALGLIAGVALLVGVAGWKFTGPALGRIEDWLRSRETAARPSPAAPRLLRLLAAHLGFTIVALSVRHLHLLFAAVLFGVVTGWAFERAAQGGGRWPVGVGLSVTALVAAWWLLASVAGDTPLGFAVLAEAPYSDSFELLVAPILFLAVWPLLHLAPFQSARQGPAAPVLGAVLLYRLGPTAIAGGMVHWQPVLFLLLVAAAVAAAARRNDAAILTTLGLGGIVSLEPAAGVAGVGLVVLGCVFAGAARLTASGFRLSPVGRVLASLLPVAGVALLLPVVEGMLGVEVVYCVVLVLVALVAIRLQPLAVS
ncbi:MAG: hypothetical protein SGJ01_06135 [Gemmatimonadota bacterium]|nr:hypothetical protein [Gemmatimonadota bacterium]